MDSLKDILNNLSSGKISVNEAELLLRKAPFENIDFARVDLHRKLLQGECEVIYGAGKTPEQIVAIINTLLKNKETRILITRIDKACADIISNSIDINYYPLAKIAICGTMPKDFANRGKILIVSGGTSDMPVAEEAALVCEFYGNRVERLYDVGVAGLHRLLSNIDSILNASVIIAIAGMEGALASVVGGLANCPVIAVPTSVGYGASFNGLAALLSMLNSCASGVATVNIDNGFGAAYMAHMINSKGENK